jgi:hypothetical protein
MRFGRDPSKRRLNQDKNLIRFGRNDPSWVEEINDYNDANDYDDFVDIPAERQPTPEKYDGEFFERVRLEKIFKISSNFKTFSQNTARKS